MSLSIYRWFLLLALGASSAFAGGYVAPKVGSSMFDSDAVALLEVDREKLASSLAAFVINTIKPDGNARQLENAGRFIGLALHLSPRNRTAVVANFQFGRGVAPKKVEADYSAATLAEILQSRAGSLMESGGGLNQKLAGYMLAAAVEVDPENETAVYELEMYRKDVGAVDWAPVVGSGPAE